MQRVAIKELFPGTTVVRKTDGLTIEPGTDAEVVEFEEVKKKFLEEARLLARPSLKLHPGIVTVENFFETYGTAYLVMEYLEGQTRDAYGDSQEGRLPCEVVAAMTGMVLEALKAVHGETRPDGSAMVHRDIKPQNLYFTDAGHVKLLDFGAARFAGGQSDRSATAIGTEGYAALEQYTLKTLGPWTGRVCRRGDMVPYGDRPEAGIGVPAQFRGPGSACSAFGNRHIYGAPCRSSVAACAGPTTAGSVGKCGRIADRAGWTAGRSYSTAGGSGNRD